MARFLVCFLAISFLIGCGGKRVTGSVEHHQTYPFGLDQGAFSDGDKSPLLVLLVQDGEVHAYVKEWGPGPYLHGATAHEFTTKTDELECTYNLEGIMGSIVMIKTGRRYNHATETWDAFREVYGLKSLNADDFKAEEKRHQKKVEATAVPVEN